MSRSMVGLLAAVGTTMSVLAGLVHGRLDALAVAGAGAASGLAAYLALPPSKNLRSMHVHLQVDLQVDLQRTLQNP